MKNKIVYDGRTFEATDIKSGQIHLASSLPSMKLEPNTFTAVVKSEDKSLTEFTRNTPMYYYHRERLVCISYVQAVDRIGPNKYKFYGTSAIGQLIEQPHAGGIYTGQIVEEVIRDICGTVPFIIKSNLAGVKLYGWLPYANPPKRSARDNLAQVLFAIGATLKTDLDGILRIEGLWDGISGQAPQDRMYTGANVEYSAKITQIIVTEHQYIPWTEEKQLFEGTAQAGDVITFDEPMHDLAAQGFAVQASGHNWARVSAGSGTLTGKTYIHNTRQISKPVQEAAAPNVKTVEDATLVSLVNSGAVAQRLADYYRCRQRIDASVVYRGQLPGDRLAVYHPFDKTGVAACLESADISLSNTLKAQAKLLVGYLPPQIEDVTYLDFREVLTGSGQWTPPEGVTEITYVMFSGAQGGQAGQKGGDAGASKSHSYSNTSWITGEVTERGTIRLWGAGGKGGPGGTGGMGSKILQGTLKVSPGAAISYNCGEGSDGSSVNGVEAEGGTPTTFAGLTTDSGNYPSAAGWQDPITQEIFASSGAEGLPGGDGAGAIPDYAIPNNSVDLNETLKYKPSTGAYDEDGTYWPGAPTEEYSPGVAWYRIPWPSANHVGGQAGYGLGPGGVVGQTQSTPSTRGTVSADYTSATAADGLTPPTPAAPRKRGLTLGGRGGYGGGGGSAASWAGIEIIPKENSSTISVSPGSPGTGGPGGRGGAGGDGMIILFYAKAQIIPAGQSVDKNGKMLLDRLGRRMIV